MRTPALHTDADDEVVVYGGPRHHPQYVKAAAGGFALWAGLFAMMVSILTTPMTFVMGFIGVVIGVSWAKVTLFAPSVSVSLDFGTHQARLTSDDLTVVAPLHSVALRQMGTAVSITSTSQPPIDAMLYIGPTDDQRRAVVRLQERLQQEKRAHEAAQPMLNAANAKDLADRVPRSGGNAGTPVAVPLFEDGDPSQRR